MQNQSRVHCLAFAVCMGCLPASLHGQETARGDSLRLTLADARARALQLNPELAAVRLDTAIARGDLRQARVLRFNPVADALGPTGSVGSEAGISQEIEVFGQRSARISAGTAGIERSRSRVRDATRRVLGETDRNFYRLAAASRRRALADEVLALNERLASVAGRQLSAGEINRLDYNLAVIELGRSRSRSLAARREARAVTIELARLIGLPDSANLLPVLDATQHPEPEHLRLDTARITDLRTGHLGIDSLLAQAFAYRPDLTESQAAVRQAEAEATLARREAMPNIVLRAVTEPADGSGRALRPGVGFAIPLFNRNQGEIAARRAAHQQTDLALRALRTLVRAELARAISNYESAAVEVEILETTVLVPARQNRTLVEIAYREGEVGLPVLLLIRNQAIDAELEYWSAWLIEREARATLDEVTAANLAALGAPGGPR